MIHRRRFLGVLAAGVAGMAAGCLDSGPDPRPDDEATWVRELPGETTTFHASRDGLYLGSRVGDLTAVDHDGEQRWEREIEGVSPVYGVATPGDLVVAMTNGVPQEYGLASTDGEVPTVVGVDAGSGDVEWTTTFDSSEPHASAKLLGVGDHAYVVEAGGTGRVTAVGLDDGSVEWRRETGDVNAGDLHADGPVVLAPDGLRAFSHEGEERWRAEGVETDRVEADDRFVFAASDTGRGSEFQAFDADTGELRWSHDANPGESDLATDSFVTTGEGVVVGGGSATSLAPDGSVNWRVDRETVATGAPVADGRVFPVRPGDTREDGRAEVFAVDLGSGDVAWERPVPSRTRPVGYHGGPVVTNGTLVTAVESTGGEVTWTHEPPELQEAVAVERGRAYVSTRGRKDEAAPGLYAYDLPSRGG